MRVFYSMQNNQMFRHYTEVVTVQFPPGFPVFYPPVQLSCFFSQCPVFRGDQDLSNGSSSLSLRCLGPEIFEVEILIS